VCGILGKVGLGIQLDVNQERFTEALNLQKHRGPNNGAAVFEKEFAFGHRRLSIIDLSNHANQPMVSSDGRVVIVFNGEIYNFQEIRGELASRGHRFTTSSDTEVLLYAYYEYGVDCVQYLRGMFAFAVYDFRSGETLLFRDRIGIKPLYYRRTESSLTFASEIKSILHLDDYRPGINVSAVSSYMSYRYPIQDDTFFQGIESLGPGCYLKIRGSSISIHRYWNPCKEYEKQSEDHGESYYIEKLRELLLSSVRYRMISDVPSGAFLSGGVDSSVLTALMALESDRPVKTFTIGFAEEGYNEFEYAQILAQKYKTQHKQITLSGQDFLDTMVDLIGFKDAPLSVPNEVPLFLMSKELKKDITVVLSGEGADEVFGGYGRIFRSTDDYLRAKPAALAELPDDERKLFTEKLKSKYGVTSFESELEHFLNIYRYTSMADKKGLLNPDIDVDGIEIALTQRFQNIFDELPGGCSYFDRMSWAFMRIHVPGLLSRVDTTTMAASVEARVPFLDHRLVEFMCSVPQHYKIKWNAESDRIKSRLLLADEISERYDTPKYLLKKAYEGVVPDAILYRRKMGFPVPLNDWFGGKFHDYARDILLSSNSRTRGIIDANGVSSWLGNDDLAVDHGHAMKIWMLVNIELFCEKYIDRKFIA
jgi:asparagine synthase (glutamine-hydrolysing)